MFLKMKFIDLNMQLKGKKSNTWQTVLGIAAAILLAMIIFWAMKKAGVFSNETFASIKEEFSPFG